MSTSANHINLSRFLSLSVLGNRATARLLAKEIDQAGGEHITLDFSDIEFASRSFMDELNGRIGQREHIKVDKVNMNDQVSKMDELVQSGRRRMPPRNADFEIIKM